MAKLKRVAEKDVKDGKEYLCKRYGFWQIGTGINHNNTKGMMYRGTLCTFKRTTEIYEIEE